MPIKYIIILSFYGVALTGDMFTSIRLKNKLICPRECFTFTPIYSCSLSINRDSIVDEVVAIQEGRHVSFL